MQASLRHGASPASAGILDASDMAPVSVVNPEGKSDIVIACDHAGHGIPGLLSTLGLSDRELESHIAWDIGARTVSEEMSRRLDATLVLQNFSRLVIDCNRDPASEDSIALNAEWGPIPGNAHLAPEDAAARRREIFEPYHEALRSILDERHENGRRAMLVAIHSFTPALRGVERPWHVSVMFEPGSAFADSLIKLLTRDERLAVGANLPYALDPQIDFTLPVHGQRRGLPHLGVEIRQDLLATEAEQIAWGRRLSSLLTQVVSPRIDARNGSRRKG